MNTTKTFNATALHIYIAENGNRTEKKRICQVGGFSETTLNKALRGHMPDFPVRLGIFKATGIKISEEDHFEDHFPVQNLNVS